MSRAFYCLGHETIIRSTRVPARLTSRPFSALTTGCPTKTTQIQSDKQTANTYPRHLKLITALNYVNSSRNIFTQKAIGMDRFEMLREKNGARFEGEAKERFLKRMEEQVESGNYKMIFKDDLVSLIALSDQEDNLDMLEKIITESEGEQAIFFRGWGATVMRLYYKMGLWERAERNMKDTERFGEFFNMRTCYKILLTMLYDAGQYEKVWDLYQFSRERGLKLVRATQGDSNEMYVDRVLASNVLAALAKIGNASAFERAKELWQEVYISPKSVGFRLSSFMAYIAYKNEDYAYAMNVISGLTIGNYVSLRDLNMLCLMKAGRYEEISARLQGYRAEAKLSGRNFMLRSTYDALNEIKANIQEQYLRNEFDDILIEIEAGQLIQEDTLENMAFQPIDLHPRTDFTNPRDDRRPYNQDRGMDRDTSRFRQYDRRGPRREFVPRVDGQYQRDQYNEDSPRRNNNNNYRQDNRRSYQEDEDGEYEDDLDERPAPPSRRGGGGGRNRFSHQNKLFE